MAIWHARGDQRVAEAPAASAFTKGDLLCYTATSALSRMPTPYTGALRVAGVAMTPSDRSVNGKVTYQLPDFSTVFWSDMTADSAYTKGALIAFAHGTHRGSAQHFASGSATTLALGVAEENVAETANQSVQSRVLFRFVSHDGKVNHS